MASGGNLRQGRAIRIIQAGLGGWGRDWRREVLPHVPDVELVAAVDPVGQAYARLRDALDAVEGDAVLITAPAELHVELALEALTAGLHVLVEKPFAYSVDEALPAVKLAERQGLTLMVSQNYRFFPAARAAAALVADAQLGRLNLARVDFRKCRNVDPKPGYKHYRLAHPLLFDMAIHHFDLMRMVLGQEPVEVYAKVTDPEWSPFDNTASAVLTMSFSGGAVVSYRGSWISSGAETTWTGDWRVECENGEIYWTGRSGGAGRAGYAGGDLVELRRIGEAPKPVELPSLPAVGRAGAMLEFVRAIRSGAEPETSGRRNLPSLALAEAAVRSAKSGQPEPVPAP